VSLRSLPPLLGRESTLARALQEGEPVLAVPETATSYVIAALSEMSSTGPILVVTATATDADRLAHDIRFFVDPESVELFPAWDTLPFERVSPEVQTMGQRLHLLWRLAGVERIPPKDGAEFAPPPPVAPSIIVAPIRAVLQIMTSDLEAARPVAVARGDRIDQHDLVERLVTMGYRREYQVEHVGEVAVRGGIIDVFPSRFVSTCGETRWIASPPSTPVTSVLWIRSKASWCSGAGSLCPQSRFVPELGASCAKSLGVERTGTALPRVSGSTEWSPGSLGSSKTLCYCPTCWARAPGSSS
jgi:hypothetical protein